MVVKTWHSDYLLKRVVRLDDLDERMVPVGTFFLLLALLELHPNSQHADPAILLK